MRGPFATRLRGYIQRSGLSVGELARRSGLSASYWVRLEGGSRLPGEGGVVGALARALRLSERETVGLYLLAGFAPEGWNTLAEDDVVWAVTTVLRDPAIDGVARSVFRQTVLGLAARWLPEEGG